MVRKIIKHTVRTWIGIFDTINVICRWFGLIFSLVFQPVADPMASACLICCFQVATLPFNMFLYYHIRNLWLHIQLCYHFQILNSNWTTFQVLAFWYRSYKDIPRFFQIFRQRNAINPAPQLKITKIAKPGGKTSQNNNKHFINWWHASNRKCTWMPYYVFLIILCHISLIVQFL